jgi:hypothetical protein
MSNQAPCCTGISNKPGCRSELIFHEQQTMAGQSRPSIAVLFMASWQAFTGRRIAVAGISVERLG